MSDADELVALGRAFHRAWADSDVGRLDGLLADDYFHVDIHGQVFDRTAWLAYAADQRTTGELGFDDERVAVLGDVGVVTSELTIPALDDAQRVRIMQVWRRTANGWRRAWYQATVVRPS